MLMKLKVKKQQTFSYFATTWPQSQSSKLYKFSSPRVEEKRLNRRGNPSLASVKSCMY
ncbi:hypothetical protein C1H46_045702 [Malus baccata]|uniref:Uncharacterized protein n=1 Tax=Malus baccata TaxID=106549 RepID=A0A540K3E3_MALBA|nr:hypothetical protein C1H46_045702 [Malus baccata]